MTTTEDNVFLVRFFNPAPDVARPLIGFGCFDPAAVAEIDPLLPSPDAIAVVASLESPADAAWLADYVHEDGVALVGIVTRRAAERAGIPMSRVIPHPACVSALDDQDRHWPTALANAISGGDAPGG
jgi:hypothetical protein